MKTTIRLAWLEINTLFYSPIAWLLSTVFLFQCGLIYTNLIQNLLLNQGLGGIYLQYLDFSTEQTFAGRLGLFVDIQSKIYLYLPLLTMGLISREVNSGTIKLLYSSPIKVSQIVLGKFFAMVGYSLLLIGILAIFAVTGLYNIKSADAGMIFSGLLGIFLLLCAYSAIGLFMSCLTSYQIVAAISTLVVFAVLNYIGNIGQDIDFVRDLTYFLSLAGRTRHMLAGMISSKDVLYFVLIVTLFLLFSWIKLQSGRESRSPLRTTARYLGVFIGVLLLGYISRMPALIGYLDATADKRQTLTPPTQQVLKDIGNDPLVVTSFVNLLDQRYYYGKPDQRNMDMDRWEGYIRFKPNISFKYVYYYDEPLDENNPMSRSYPGKSVKEVAQSYASSYKVSLNDYKSPEEMRRIIDLRPEQNRYVMQLNFRNKTTFLRLFNDAMVFPSETETTAALKRMTQKVPRIAFLQGEYERSTSKLGPVDYGFISNNIVYRNSLVNQGFDAVDVLPASQDLPTDIAALVIGDPRSDFSPAVLQKIQQYIADGGNLLIAGEPGKQNVLNPLLQPLGVKLLDGMLLQNTKDYPKNMVTPLLTTMAKDLTKELETAFGDSIGVSMPGVCGLSYTNNGSFSIQPLLMTNPDDTWLRKGEVVLDSADLVYSAANGDDRTAVPTALALTRKVNGKEQRIIVTGDADFLTPAALSRQPNVNFGFNNELLRFFTYGQFPIDASRPAPRDNRIRLTLSGMSGMKFVFLGILPGILLIFSAIFLIRRKRK
jgi:ABC-2 type transport system permease protein